ncbi:type II CAAX endopeptidase family protein [Mycoplasmatota bacterium zrk1]
MKKELREVSIFFILVIFLSYFVFWGPIALFKVPTVNLLEDEMGPIWAVILFIIGGFIPSIVGLILTGVYEGKKGVRQLFRRSLRIDNGIKWIFSIIIIGIYFAVSLILIYTLIGGKFEYNQFLIQLPGIIPLIILGPLSEEFGWRGFAVKRLLKSTNANFTSLIIGVIWAMWHLPLFYMVGTFQYSYNLPFIAFLISVTGSSFVYTYLFIRTKHSLLSAIFLHWIYTYIIQVVSSSVVRSELFNWLELVPGLLIGLVFAFVLYKDKDKFQAIDL